MDTWWQTETGSIMISPLPGLTRAKPGSAIRPLPGESAALFDESTGQAVVAYVTLGQDATSGPGFEAELRGHRARRCHHPGRSLGAGQAAAGHRVREHLARTHEMGTMP